MKKIILFFLIILIMLYFPNNSYASQENESVQINQNISKDILSNINYQQLDAGICQKVNEMEIPSRLDYPLGLDFDINSMKLPFAAYIQKNHPYPPIIVALFLVLFIGLKLEEKVINSAYKKVCNFFAFGSLVVFIMIGLAWANLLYLNTQITERKQFDNYIKISSFITKSYETLLSWVWQDNPVLKVNAYIVSDGIQKSFQSGDALTAAKYADYDQSIETLALREEAFLGAAQSLYQEDKFQEALMYAEKAFKLTGSNRAYKTNQIIRAIFAVAKSSDGKFEQSQMELAKIDGTWNDDLLNKSWAAVVYLHLRFLSQSDNYQPNYHEAANILKSYLQFFSKYSKQTAPYQLQCLYASFLEKLGETQLNANNTGDAIEKLEAVESLIANQSTTNALLTNSFFKQGLDFVEQRDTKKAIISLEKAHNKTTENKSIKCALSSAYMADARDFAYFGNVDESKAQSTKAESLCHFEGIDDIHADISLAIGKWYMRNGNWEMAKKSFLEVDEHKTPDKFKLSSQFYKDALAAPNRLAKLDDARNWIENMPRVTGSNCYSEDCSKVEFFDGERRIGMAFSDMSRIEFEENGKNLVLKDSKGSGRIDISEITEGMKRHVIVESDGDYRLDSELFFDKDGKKIDEKNYSGRVLIHVPNGVIANSCEWHSGCDAYLVVRKNGDYVGKTDTINNTPYPSWNQAFVVNYRKDDQIYMKMFDEDVFVDDFIDDFKISQFPTTGVIKGVYGKAAIQVRVEPTTLPEGAYDVKNIEKQANTFRYADFVKQDPELKSITDKANRSEENSATMAKVASFAIPTLTVPWLGVEGIMAKLSGFLIGETVKYQLNNNDTVKHEQHKSITVSE